VSPNKTTLGSIQTLFAVKKFNSLLGANNLPFSTSTNASVAEQETIKVPIPCICVNGTGVSNKVPVYKVQPDDGLWHIANEVFGALVTAKKIQEANKITNISRIEIGQELWIPLPCSCDQVVEGEKVLHYGYLVATGDSLAVIGNEFGVNQDTIKTVNDIANDTELIIGNVLDLPLKACSSSIRNDSEDSTLLVSNNTYAVTANQCVKCQCSSNNWILECEASGLKPTNWRQCPSSTCEGSNILSLSNSTTVGCDLTTCSYAGYSSANQTISTSLESTSTCPAAAPNSNDGSRINLNWIFFAHMVLVSLCFLL
jgi:LysM repeat protein